MIFSSLSGSTGITKCSDAPPGHPHPPASFDKTALTEGSEYRIPTKAS